MCRQAIFYNTFSGPFKTQRSKFTKGRIREGSNIHSITRETALLLLLLLSFLYVCVCWHYYALNKNKDILRKKMTQCSFQQFSEQFMVFKEEISGNS